MSASTARYLDHFDLDVTLRDAAIDEQNRPTRSISSSLSLAGETTPTSPLGGFDPFAPEGSGAAALGIREDCRIARGTIGIGLEELGLGNGESRADHDFAEIATVDRDDGHRPSVA